MIIILGDRVSLFCECLFGGQAIIEGVQEKETQKKCNSNLTNPNY